jgi:hypothetical protein
LIPEADQARWADLISKGIGDIESFLKASFGSTKLEYYVSSRIRDTSFSIPGYDGPPRVFLASDRVVRGAAPYIHEAVHHLVFRLRLTKRPPNHISGSSKASLATSRTPWWRAMAVPLAAYS